MELQFETMYERLLNTYVLMYVKSATLINGSYPLCGTFSAKHIFSLFTLLGMIYTILPGTCQVHAKHGTIQYSSMDFYRNIHTRHARHMPVTINTKDILSGTCLAWHLPSMAMWISNVPVVHIVIAMVVNSPSLSSRILHHWWHDMTRAEYGMWRYVWTLLAWPGMCLHDSKVWIKPYYVAIN